MESTNYEPLDYEDRERRQFELEQARMERERFMAFSDMKTGEGKYLKASDLKPRQEIKLMIDRFEKELVGQEDAEEKYVLYFRVKPGTNLDKLINGRGLVLNNTNLDTLMEGFGDVEPEVVSGEHVILYRTTTKFRGETVACLRLRVPGKMIEEDAPPF